MSVGILWSRSFQIIFLYNFVRFDVVQKLWYILSENISKYKAAKNGGWIIETFLTDPKWKPFYLEEKINYHQSKQEMLA